MANYRVEFIVVNNTGLAVQCVNTCCEGFDVPGFTLSVGTTIQNGQRGTFRSATNDRIFATFTEVGGAGAWQMAMTSPKSSRNSACGSLMAGLQIYSRTGTPTTFTFIPGQPNQADWNHGDKDDGDVVRYCDCSA